MSELLKLRAADSEDVQVISAVLQDSIVPVCDMIYRTEGQNFVVVAQRLRRENTGGKDRICCALTITGVTSVQTQGIDLRDGERILNLLALMIDASALTLIFAGDAKIRLELGAWSALAEDFGEPWPAFCNPCHDEAATA